MGIFDTPNSKSIIKNEEILNCEYVPKEIPFRENQIQEIANAIKPMLNEMGGSNLFVYGGPGIGKTASIKWVLRELEETTDKIVPLYVNCWNLKTKFFIFSNIANQLNISFTAGKSSEHILQQIIYKLKEKNPVFVFDEIDKIEDTDFLYQIISNFPNSSIHLVSNKSDYLSKIDPRIKSRIMLGNLEFKPYSIEEIKEILKQRTKLAFVKDSINPVFITQLANITYNKKDIRVGIHLLKESARISENKGKSKIEKEHIKEAIEKVFEKKPEEDKLNKDEFLILKIVKENSGEIAGELFEKYKSKNGKLSYKSFKRYAKRLGKLGLLKLKKTSGGFKGRSTRIFIKD